MKWFNILFGTFALISTVTASSSSKNKYRCGKDFGKCESGKCCSKYGWCGRTSDYCSLSKGCQSEFGECEIYNSSSTKKSTKTSKITKSIKYITKLSTAKKSSSTTKKASVTNNDDSVISNIQIVNTGAKYKAVKSSNEVTNNLKSSNVVTSNAKTGNVKWAGFRYSSYGLKESFNQIPNVSNWKSYVNRMKGHFYDNTKGAIILIVGVEHQTTYCSLGFPKPDNVSSSLKVKFSSKDEFEEVLTNFDKNGYNVWLQVEAGDNDLVKLADLVLDRYGHHPSVSGFGVDCEWWYRNYSSDNHGKPLSDSEAKRIVQAVRKRNPKYTVFAKHWKTEFMPPTYRDGMIFVNDSQGFSDSFDRMKKEFKKWAEYYSGNPVLFQIGYNKDKNIWEDDPVKIVKTVADEASAVNKNIGIIWVDFTLKDVIEKF